jgi:type I restriction enzyme, S subunit
LAGSSHTDVATWPTARLDEGATITAGRSPRYTSTGAVRVVGANGPIGRTSESNASGGIAVGRVGASGALRRVSEPTWLSDNVLHVAPRADAWDESFLFHVLGRAGLERLATKTAQPLLTQTELGAVRLPKPSIPEQRSIARILDAIDEAIDRIEEVTAATEKLGRALLNELLTRGLPGRHTDWKFVANLGSVPACWEVVRLDEVLLDIEAGGAPPRLNRPAAANEWGVLRVGSVTWGEYHSAENKALGPGTEPDPTLEVHAGDLLLGRANTPALVGRTVLVRATPPRRLLSDKTLRLVPAPERTNQEFLHLVLSARASRAQLTGAASGSSRSMFNVSQQSIRNVTVPLPPIDEQRRITDATAALRERARLEAAELDALRTVKKAASEALLTGHLRVSVTTRPAISA